MCCVSGGAAEKDLLCLCVFTFRLEVVLFLVEAADLLRTTGGDKKMNIHDIQFRSIKKLSLYNLSFIFSAYFLNMFVTENTVYFSSAVLGNFIFY